MILTMFTQKKIYTPFLHLPDYLNHPPLRKPRHPDFSDNFPVQSMNEHVQPRGYVVPRFIKTITFPADPAVHENNTFSRRF